MSSTKRRKAGPGSLDTAGIIPSGRLLGPRPGLGDNRRPMKMKIPLFQIDAFTKKLFSGNPAAVCPMRVWPKDRVLQQIAAENNLSETAFIVGGKGNFRIRWFT